MHGYVLFDNNAYKRVSRDRLARIVEAERRRGIIALASTAVLQELLARVRDLDAEQRGRNRAAIRKLWEHCRTDRDGQTVINFMSHTDSQIFWLLSGHQHPDDKEAYDRLGETVRVVAQSDNDDALADIANELATFEKAVARVEEAYVLRIAKLANAENPEPNEMKRNLRYAEALTSRTQQLYGRQFSAEHIVTRLVDAMKLTSIGFALQDSVVAEVRAKRGGQGQHKNTVWDEELVSSTSIYTTITGKSLLVVTEEDRLLAAAAKAAARDRVISVSQYEETLGLLSSEDMKVQSQEG